MNSSERNDVSRTLGDWEVRPQRDPGFRSAVWARIERVKARRSWTGYARSHAAVLAGALAVALAVGGWVGRERAQARVAADRAQIASAYVQALDARTMSLP
jgi:hypothetical protein